MTMISLVCVVVMVLAALVVIILWLVLSSERRHRAEEIVQHEEDKAQAVVLALRGQKSTISGTIAEKFCPFAPEYPYNLNDVVAVFDTCDFMVFTGRTDGKITEVVFQEMKSGDPRLSDLQRQLRDCVKTQRVRWETWQFKDGKWILVKEVNHEIPTDRMS